MSGTEARLYVSWKHSELDYYIRNVDSFCLQTPKDYVKFRKYVLNIIDWGKNNRLKEIRDSLDNLLEESRRRTSEAAKSRRPPSNDSASSTSRKRKSSSSSKHNGGAKTIQERSGGTPPSTSFQEYNQYDSSVPIPTADSEYAPPPASFQEYN